MQNSLQRNVHANTNQYEHSYVVNMTFGGAECFGSYITSLQSSCLMPSFRFEPQMPPCQ
jgi:hypothetical protein